MLNINMLQPMGREMLNTSPFGGNNGKQGIFDMNDPDQQSQAVQRLLELHQGYGERLRPNYSGPTGLQKNDGEGFAKMQNAVVEAENIKRTLTNRNPMNIQFGGVMEGLQSAAPIPKQHGGSPYQVHQSFTPEQKAMGQGSHEDFMRRYGGK